MRISILSSGSQGNSALIRTDSTTLLIDAGLSYEQIRKRLALHGVSVEELDAVLLTHSHTDHTAGLTRLANLHSTINIFSNELTMRGIRTCDQESFVLFQEGTTFKIGDVEVTPIPVSHDAPGTVGYRLNSDRGKAILYLTDLGFISPAIHPFAKEVDLIVLESDYEPELLQSSSRPQFLKQRIAGRNGHLSNHDAANFIRNCVTPRLKNIILVHLSRSCNSPTLAKEVMSKCLYDIDRNDIGLTVSTPQTPTPLIEL